MEDTQWIFSEEELEMTPSRKDGVKLLQEAQYRRQEIALMQGLGTVFKIPFYAIRTAVVYFHRFFARESFLKHDRYLIGVTSLFLGAKVEDSWIKVADLAKHYLRRMEHTVGRDVAPSQKLHVKELSELIIFTESVVLHTLAYDLGVVHPYVYINAHMNKIVEVLENSIGDGDNDKECDPVSSDFIKPTFVFV